MINCKRISFECRKWSLVLRDRNSLRACSERLTLDVPAGLTDASVTPTRGDHDADPIMRKIAEVRPIRPAAVLVPIVDHPEPTVLLTQRAQHLPDHAGQVSFPGGKIDKDDTNPCASALREAKEEIGLDNAHIDPLGYLDLYMTTLGYRIVPVIARVKPGFQLELNHGRSRYDLRGAARFSDGSGQCAAPFARMAGHDAALLRDHFW